MLTLTYKDYAQKRVARDAVRPPDRGPNPFGPVLYAGLSPFDIPEAVTVEVQDSQTCVFEFAYANNEPSEALFRTASHDDSIAVLLGRATRKILQVRLLRAQEQLAVGNPQLDPGLVQDWVNDLPSQAYNTATRNAELVNSVLRSFPGTFRREILRALQQQPCAKVSP